MPVRLRRSRALALELRGRRLVAHDVLDRHRFEIDRGALELLQAFDRFKSADQVARELAQYESGSVLRSIERLRASGLLVAEGSPQARRQEALEGWTRWQQAATCFHFATRGTRFAVTQHELDRVVARVTRTEMPSIYKDLPGPRLPLPLPLARLAPRALGQALVERRTCREFLRKPLPRRHLDAVTALGFGRLGRIDGGPFGTLLHRSAPSGGGRHAIEGYLMALDVAGLESGLYHVSVRDHALVPLGRPATRAQVTDFTWGQDYFADAAAVFVLTALFERSQWKYRAGRAYRVLLLDAGHLCQNLLLVATSLGLGAFETAALDDEAIEAYLGIDGIREGVLYLAGIGWPDRKRFRRGIRGGLLPGAPVE